MFCTQLISYLLPAAPPPESSALSKSLHEKPVKVSQAIPAATGIMVQTGNRPAPLAVVEPVDVSNIPEVDNEGEDILLAKESWVGGILEFSALLASQGAFPRRAADEGIPKHSGFLGKVVGSIYQSLKYWNEIFGEDIYVEQILRHGYKIPVKMSESEAKTVNREKNNKNARSEIAYVREEVARLVQEGQVVEADHIPRCTNRLSVAFKVNADGTIKKRLVIDLSRWINKFVIPDSFRMSRFQEALALSTAGDFQSLIDVSKAYHHIRLHPTSWLAFAWMTRPAKSISTSTWLSYSDWDLQSRPLGG
jgi:hypothetical protein